jgi:hypothetical protein
MRVPLGAQSIAVANGRIYVLVRRGEKLTLLALDENLEVVREKWSVRGNTGFILRAEEDRALISVENKL